MKNIDLLLNRQSSPSLKAPAPSNVELDIILKAGMRVPDHGALTPWHFTVVKESSLSSLSDIFVEAIKEKSADKVKLEKTAKMPFRAPLIIIVSTQYQRHDKVPSQEQLVAAGCSVHAMQIASFGLGYGAMWRTGELSYNPIVKERLNISDKDDIVGFLYIGSNVKEVPCKKSKAYDSLVSYL